MFISYDRLIEEDLPTHTALSMDSDKTKNDIRGQH